MDIHVDREELFRDLCENSHDLIQSITPDGHFLYVNRAWLQTLGYSEGEVTGMRALDIADDACREELREVFAEVMAGKEIDNIETTVRAKDGRRILVQGSANCRFEEDRPLFARMIFRDVTERRSEQDQLDRLFNVSLDMLCVAGTDGFFKRVNPAFERVLGYDTEELLSRPFFDFVHPDDRDQTRAALERLSDGESVIDFKNRYRASDGNYRWLAWRSSPMVADGMVYAVARDITEERERQELLVRQAEELERSNRELEQFAAMASHDLRSPLRTVANLAEWIDEELGQDEIGEAREHLGQIRTRVARMQRLIDELLEYSRAGTPGGEPQEVDSSSLVEEIAELLTPGGIRIHAAASLPTLVTLRTPLEQVLRNLITNAIRHHDRRVGHVDVSARTVGERIEFAVADDGPGIPAADRRRVFEMFQRLAPDEAAGSGIGLALVERIVTGFGGRVWVDGPEERGTTVRFTWPSEVKS